MATPSYSYVIDQINTFIVANGNNEITANVLNPILEIITDFANNHMGDLDNLTTDQTDTLVDAINSLKQNINDIVGNSVQLHVGNANPNDVPPTSYNYGDFFMQLSPLDNDPIQLWQFDGFGWTTSLGNSTHFKGFFDATALTPTIDNTNGVEGDEYKVINGGVNVDFGGGDIFLNTDDIIIFYQSEWMVKVRSANGDIKNKKWVIFGESLSDSLDDTHYTYYTIEKLGLTGTVTNAVGGHRIDQQIEVLDNLLSTDPNYFDDFDICSLMIGINDCGQNTALGTVNSTVGASDFAGRMKYFIETVITANPNIQLYIITPPEIDSVSRPYRAVNAAGYTLRSYYDMTSQIASYYALQLIDLGLISGFNEQTISYFTSDGIHPNQIGASLLGNLVADGFVSNTNKGNRFSDTGHVYMENFANGYALAINGKVGDILRGLKEGTLVLKVDENGNLAIGTNSPYVVSGWGSVTLNGNNGGFVALKKEDVLRGLMSISEDTVILAAMDDDYGVALVTNGFTRLWVHPNTGNVSIGNNNDNYRLNISGTIESVSDTTDGTDSGQILLSSLWDSTSPGFDSNTSPLGIINFKAHYPGTGTGIWASIRAIAGGTYSNAGNTHPAKLVFYTTGTAAAATLTERMRIHADGNVSIGNTNNIYKLDVTGDIRATSRLITGVFTVGTLPSGTAGARAFVTDANSTTFGSVVAGGGSNGVPVYNDGTNWRIG